LGRLCPYAGIKPNGSDPSGSNLDNPTAIKEFIAEHPTKRTMPQIWIDGEHVGGYKELKSKLS